MKYEHSAVFARLKGIKEGIEQQLTSYQYLTSLDYFLENAIDPIVTAMPDMVDNYFAKVIAWQVHKPSIKFSRINKFDLPTILFNSITTDNSTKRKHQKDMLLNRGLLFGLITLFSQALNNYRLLHDPCFPVKLATRRTLIAKTESLLGSPYLYAASMQSAYWARQAFNFKELIVQKYTRLALMRAKATYEDVDFKLKLDDIIQTYMLFLSKAIDRCDSRQGVLTTFIQTWFYSAKAACQKEALTGDKNSSYEELMESTLPSVSPDTSYEDIQHICFKAKAVDPAGTLRYSLNIPEFYSKQDLTILHSYMLSTSPIQKISNHANHH